MSIVLIREDEVLYHARVHPEHKTNTLSEQQLTSLHHNIVYVCQTAVDVNADASKFPEHWLFRHRWVSLSQSSRLGLTYETSLRAKVEMARAKVK